VTYKDTADDGNWGNTLENDFGFRNTEFEVINRDMEPRLKFINAAGQLWQMAGVRLAADLHAHRDQPMTPVIEQTIQAVRDWRTQAQRWQVDLAELMEGIWDHEIAGLLGRPRCERRVRHPAAGQVLHAASGDQHADLPAECGPAAVGLPACR
jgi:hypothetical protein